MGERTGFRRGSVGPDWRTSSCIVTPKTAMNPRRQLWHRTCPWQLCRSRHWPRSLRRALLNDSGSSFELGHEEFDEELQCRPSMAREAQTLQWPGGCRDPSTSTISDGSGTETQRCRHPVHSSRPASRWRWLQARSSRLLPPDSLRQRGQTARSPFRKPNQAVPGPRSRQRSPQSRPPLRRHRQRTIAIKMASSSGKLPPTLTCPSC